MTNDECAHDSKCYKLSYRFVRLANRKLLNADLIDLIILKGLIMIFFLVRNTHKLFTEAMQYTYKSKETIKFPQNC